MLGGKLTLFGSAIFGAGLALSAPAQAAVGDAAWGRCVWQAAPVSAAAWLGMAAPAWTDNLATPAERLGHRLIALCATAAADERRPNRNPSWGRLQNTLRGARPRELGAADAAAPATLLCEHRVIGEGAGSVFRIDIVRVAADGARLTSFQQYFALQEGRQLRLPQDLRILPRADSRVSVACRAITSAGELADAQA